MFRKNLSIKLILFLCIFISIFALTSTHAYASKEDQKVYDNASLLTEDEVNKLEALSSTYGEKGKIDIVVVTINDSNIGDYNTYLGDMYDSIGFGYDKILGDTAMIIVDMNARKVSIQGYGKAETYLSSERGDIIRDKITPYLTDGEYYKACSKFIELSSKYMKINPNISPNNVIFQLWFQTLIPLGIGLVVVGLMAYQSGGKVTVTDNTYLDHNSSNVRAQRDDYIRSSVTRIPKPKPSNNSHGGGGGGISSGGSSHSTSSGSF